MTVHRRSVPPPALAIAEVATSTTSLSVADFAMRTPKRKRSYGVPPAARERARAQARAMMASDETPSPWLEATPVHFVALYELLYAVVYGEMPIDLEDSKPYARAATEAAECLRVHFGGDQMAMLNYVRWSWKREEERETWRRENQRSGGRIGWRLQFRGPMLADYRLDQARMSGR